MTVGERCRIVTDTDGERHVGSWVGSPAEAQEQLSLEAALHGTAGWDIEIVLDDTDRIFHLLLTGPGGSRRRMWAETFDPLDDKPPYDPDASSGRASRRRGRN